MYSESMIIAALVTFNLAIHIINDVDVFIWNWPTFIRW